MHTGRKGKHKNLDRSTLPPLQSLSNAVIAQAAADYAALYRSKRVPKGEKAARMARIEEFFLSDRFRLFTKLEGAHLLELIRKNLGEWR